jgi:hypothetical protein
MEGMAEGADDQVVDAENSLITITTRVRTTIKPLLRYGKLRFIDLIRLLRMGINMAKSPHIIDRPNINDCAQARKFGYSP